MIGTVNKPFEEVLEAVSGYEKLGVVGCNGCAKVCKTGGEEAVAAMAKKLEDAGKQVVVTALPDRTCYTYKTHDALDPVKDKVAEAQALVVLGCGGAVQITRKVTEDYGMVMPIKIALNAVGHMDTLVKGELATEQCQECGDCMLNDTGGICPVTKCAKSLINGPCGGSQNGKCEVDPNRDCAWVLIYNRLSALGELDRLRNRLLAKDWSLMARPRTLNIKEGRVE